MSSVMRLGDFSFGNREAQAIISEMRRERTYGLQE